MSPLSELLPTARVECNAEAHREPRGAPVIVDPRKYPGWDALVFGHPAGSFFHGSAWARVLHETYGHRPVYFCRVESGRLKSLLPIMEVSSPLTGRRGASLPFTDFCTPISDPQEDGGTLFDRAVQHGADRNWRYLECRSQDQMRPGISPSLVFHGHIIDLDCEPDALFKRVSAATRRGVRKAEKEGLHVEFGANLDAIRTFYQLHCHTRRRHGLPPQPFRFFENISRHVMEHGQGFVAIARLKNRPLAAGIFFHNGREVIYKFGASLRSFQHLRPNNLMMWESIKLCAGRSLKRLNLGRTSVANEGLRRFKLGFGAVESRIEYCKYDFARKSFVRDVDRAEGWVNYAFRILPLPVLRILGQVLYPHLS